MSDGGLGSVVGSLSLRDVNDGGRHASDHDDAALALLNHQLGGLPSAEVGSVDLTKSLDELPAHMMM
jgi:hypothetical protein